MEIIKGYIHVLPTGLSAGVSRCNEKLLTERALADLPGQCVLPSPGTQKQDLDRFHDVG